MGLGAMGGALRASQVAGQGAAVCHRLLQHRAPGSGGLPTGAGGRRRWPLGRVGLMLDLGLSKDSKPISCAEIRSEVMIGGRPAPTKQSLQASMVLV